MIHEKKSKIPDFMDIDTIHNPQIYNDILYKSKRVYNLNIPILDKLGIKYETWNNPNNTAGTCFWHATSKALGIPMDELTKKIETLKSELPPCMKKKYKTRTAIANQLSDYKINGFGVNPTDYCILSKLEPDVALVVFYVIENCIETDESFHPLTGKPNKSFIHPSTGAVTCYGPKNGIKPTKVVFMCDILLVTEQGDVLAHIEIMTLNNKNLHGTWMYNIKNVAIELKSILKHKSCKFIEKL